MSRLADSPHITYWRLVVMSDYGVECVRKISCAIAVVLMVAAPAAAQQDRPDERRLETLLRPGMAVWISDAAGREQRLQIDSVTGTTLTGTGDKGQIRQLPLSEVVRVRVRQPDSVLDGAVIGAGTAIASGLFLCTRTEPWRNCRDDVGPILGIGAIGAGAGMAIDALIRGRHTIFERSRTAMRLTAAPFVASRARGVTLVLTF